MTTNLTARARCYHELATLLWNHGQWGFAERLGLQKPVEDGVSESSRTDAEEMVAAIERLGPVYIKFAQVASTRRDLVPQVYLQALTRLQENVEAVPFEDVAKVVEEELGQPIDSLYADFAKEPIACASIAQVHQARLRDGREVVVKVQRPGIISRAKEQLESLQTLSDIADRSTEIGKKFRFASLLRAVRYAFNLECDYVNESNHLKRFKENLAEYDRLVVPDVVDSLSTRRVLTMQRIVGRSLAQCDLESLETELLAGQLVEAYLKQGLIDGLLHADPHPGNIFLTDSGEIALLDAGMVVHFSNRMRRQLAQLILAITQSDGDEAARIAADIGSTDSDFELDEFAKEIGRIVARTRVGLGEEISIGQVLVELLTASGSNGVEMPPEMILFNKALLQIEDTLLRLDPELNLSHYIKAFCPRIMQADAKSKLNLAKMTRTAMAAAEFSSEFPQRLNRISQLLADNQLRINVDAIDEKTLIAGIEKVANRIAAGLVSAALLISASVLLHIASSRESMMTLFLAIGFFLLAASVGLYLIYHALIKDQFAKEGR